MSDRPEPLTPADCDLRDFHFMPLEIQRLRRSKAWLKAKRNPALAFYQINLWTAAWHDLPAGSLEDDDDVLADLAMCDPSKWEKVREEVMRGWVKCSDGRLYNPTVCEKARESWAAKLERKAKEDHDKERKRREREDRARIFALLKDAGQVPPWNTPTTELRRLVTDLSHGQVRDGHDGAPRQSRLREGEGQREGQGQGDLTTTVPYGTDADASDAIPPPDDLPPEPQGLDAKDAIFQLAVPWLVERQVKESNARSLLGAAAKQMGDGPAWGLCQRMMAEKPIEPAAWLAAAINKSIGKGKGNRHGNFDKQDYRAGVEADGSF